MDGAAYSLPIWTRLRRWALKPERRKSAAALPNCPSSRTLSAWRPSWRFSGRSTRRGNGFTPHILPIGAGMGSAPAQPRSHGRLALFVKADCPPCDKTLTKLLASQKPFDIYLVGSEGQDAKVREWASRRHIPAERVKTRAITLNHDAGRWLKLGKGQMPVVLEQGENGWLPVAF